MEKLKLFIMNFTGVIKRLAILIALAALTLIVCSVPFNRNWESVSRATSAFRVGQLVKKFHERHKSMPTSLPELFNGLPDLQVEERQNTLWPEWAFKYIGNYAPDWTPLGGSTNNDGPYEIDSNPLSPVVIQENELIAKKSGRKYYVSKDYKVSYRVVGRDW